MRNLLRAALGLVAIGVTAGALFTAAGPAGASLPPGDAPMVSSGDHKCIQPAALAGGSIGDNGNPIEQFTCNGSTQQNWLIQQGGQVTIGSTSIFSFPPLPVEWYHFVNADTGKCLDDRDGNTQNGAVVQQWQCNSTSTTMQWVLSDTQFAGETVLQNVRALQNNGQATCLDDAGNNPTDGANVQLLACSSSTDPAQHWSIPTPPSG